MKKTHKKALVLNREIVRRLDLNIVKGAQQTPSIPHQDCAPSVACSLGVECIPTGSVWAPKG